MSLVGALAEWIRLLGPERVLGKEDCVLRYGSCTNGIQRQISGALLLETVSEVIEIVRIATRLKVPLYPISTGHNWGYGTANPAVDGCVIVDLARLNRIIDFDSDLGLVTLEPGVTQKDLADFLDQNGLAFLVPTTGAGPTCSIVANALERGYGITPIADHFAAVTRLEAVLPDGRLYRPALSELGAETVDRAFKWGIGPYIDGLFAQGGFGIVTQMTIALIPQPQDFAAFFFGAKEDHALESLVEATRQLRTRLSGVTGSINLMNRHRVLAMTVPYPSDTLDSSGLLSAETVARLGQKYKVMAWSGIGALYGEREVVTAAKRVVRKILSPVTDRLLFVTPSRARLARRIASAIPGATGKRLKHITGVLDASLQIMLGRPSEVALQLAYWKMGGAPVDRGDLDPARDGCGLIWYPPLVPMRPHTVRKYVQHVMNTCVVHGIEPLITLTSLSERCFDSSVPLLFDRKSPRATEAAYNCYAALFEGGLSLGFAPYRLGVQGMRRVVDMNTVCWDLVAALKTAADPAGILAPGRYVPLRNGN